MYLFHCDITGRVNRFLRVQKPDHKSGLLFRDLTLVTYRVINKYVRKPLT